MSSVIGGESGEVVSHNQLKLILDSFKPQNSQNPNNLVETDPESVDKILATLGIVNDDNSLV